MSRKRNVRLFLQYENLAAKSGKFIQWLYRVEELINKNHVKIYNAAKRAFEELK